MAETNSELVVETFKLTKIYQNRQIALNDVTLRLEPGCVLGLLGSNGAGKTTLLRLLMGLHRPTAGWAKVFGKIMTPNAADLRRRIGFIPTNPQFPRGMTPITYLDYMARLFGLPKDIRKPRLASLIRAVDLLNASGNRIEGFSNGMTARLAVAASLINEPDLLVWDEPTHGLDPEARRSMLELIKTLSKEKTLIVSSHNLSDIDEVCNHAAVLSHGQLIYFGSLQDLKGRMCRNHYELDLEGDQKAITKAAAAIRALSDFKIVNLRQRRLELYMHEEAVNTTALANVFMALSDGKVTLVSIRSVGQQTEQAFLDLVEKEESRGFARIYQGEAAQHLLLAASGGSMEATTAKTPAQINRWLPYWAVMQADIHQTLRSWVYRFWVMATFLTTVGYLLYRYGVYREAGIVQPASSVVSELLRWTVLGSVTLIVALTASSISSERGTMADSVLSRGISRYQYFMGKLHARLASILATYFIMGFLVLVSGLFLLHEDLDYSGCVLALLTVGALMMAVISLGVTVSAMVNSTAVGIAALWIIIYGGGFALSLLPASIRTPEWVLHNLPNILQGKYNATAMFQLIGWSAVFSLISAALGMTYFARRDV